MKKVLLSFFAIITIALSSFGQSPEAFKYQAVVRDTGNLILNNQPVGLQLTIQQGAIGGTAVYAETFAITTNGYGLVNFDIGSGTTTDDFTSIDWANGPYFIETAVDITGGTNFSVMGTSQLISVPYALHAKTAENVTNDLVDDADADPLNEMNTTVILNGTNLETTDGGGTIITDLSSLQDGVTDADADATNEIELPVGGVNGQVLVTDGSGNYSWVNDKVEVYTAGTGIDITSNVISTTSACGLSIGDTYQGGIIFYLDPSGCHGLISMATDQNTGIQWHNGSNVDTYAYGNGIGSGEGNSQGIRRWQGTCNACYASELCQDLSSGGYTDWYLPSKYELNLMYQNIGKGNALGLGNVGNFPDGLYWSSTEYEDDRAWYQFFGNSGNQNNALKVNPFSVRAIRSF